MSDRPILVWLLAPGLSSARPSGDVCLICFVWGFFVGIFSSFVINARRTKLAFYLFNLLTFVYGNHSCLDYLLGCLNRASFQASALKVFLDQVLNILGMTWPVSFS